MEDSIPLLDTPKRAKLQSQADTLKTALKDFERTFAATNNGQKPSRDDIKADVLISAKYKQYNKLREIIAGKLSVEALNPPPPPPPRQTSRPRSGRHSRTDSAISLTPHRPHHTETPSKRRLFPNDIDPYDAPASVSPRVMLHAVGPTPHRDGTILGIFDMLSASGGSGRNSQQTPSSRKRKINALYHDGNNTSTAGVMIAQSPSQRRKHQEETRGEQPPATTPGSGSATGRRNHSKTPISEGKKFMLEHFFATPSAVRFATMMHGEETEHMDAQTPVGYKTPLRDQVLGLSVLKGNTPTAADATPPYLKRSFSFKERLLSASGSAKPSSTSQFTTSPGSTRTAGCRKVQHPRFAPKPLSQIIADRESQQSQQQQQQQQLNDDEDEDDLDALRDMEAAEVNLLVDDSQPSRVPATEEPINVWKKKGQKRTTRRSIMRPTKVKLAEGPKFVAAEDDRDEGEDQVDDLDTSRVEDTQFIATDHGSREPDDDDDDELEYLIAAAEQADEDDDPSHDPYEESGGEPPRLQHNAAHYSDFESPVKRRTKASSSSKRADLHDPHAALGKPPKVKPSSKTDGKGPRSSQQDPGMRKINPNAQSHMNFRSLKIRNKNSKAKGKGGRFGRGRR